jgi:hypothetical protein
MSVTERHESQAHRQALPRVNKSSVLSLRLKTGSDIELKSSVNVKGSEFQTVGAERQKALRPKAVFALL